MSTTIGDVTAAQSARGDHDRIYRNDGNAPLVALIDRPVRSVLDVGCGAGDNASLIRARFPDCEIHGVTRSVGEAEVAKAHMTSCGVWDIEGDIPGAVASTRFDVILFSHVLEHLRDPRTVLRNFSRLLRSDGMVLIAVPNVVSWAMRWEFARGRFEYQEEGILDDTHLRFFTFFTADRYLLFGNPGLQLVSKAVTGSVPLWWLRRYLMPKKYSEWLDMLGCRLWPNLFGGQIMLKVVGARTDHRK
jgi:2-polyprenyl-3-methyl-5-hydroxy-6-metoxy-1,4-benzoquinol methylase